MEPKFIYVRKSEMKSVKDYLLEQAKNKDVRIIES